jgi:hypothetical protein
MVAMRVVQVSVHQIVDMIAVWYRFVAATGAMPMGRIVSAAPMCWRAQIGIRRVHLDDMLVYVFLVRMMEMAIVQIIDMAIMAHGDVTAAGPMDMRMIGMNRMVMRGHVASSWG